MDKLRSRMEKINKKKAAAAIVIAAVVVLAVFNVYLSASGRSLLNIFAQESDELLEYKSEARKSHESIQSMISDMRAMVQEKVGGEYENYEQQLMAKFLISMQRDMEWIAGRENEIYIAIQGTLSEEEGKELFEEEIAHFMSASYILVLNLEALEVGLDSYADAELVVQEVEAEKQNITVTEFIPEGFAEPILGGTGTKEENVKVHVEEIFAEFLEFKKMEFDNASSDEKYVEATKLIGLHVLFTL